MAKFTTVRQQESGIALGGIGTGTVELWPDGERQLAEDEAPRFTGETLTMEELLQESITEDEGMGGMNL